MIIREDTPIRDLVDAKIVPLWMWRDIEPHGMYEAENILCEYDWDWNWDIGDGYNAAQLQELQRVRDAIKKGIEDFHSNPEAIRAYHEAKEMAKRHKELVEELRRKYATVVYADELPWVVEFFETYGEMPYFYLLLKKYYEEWHKLSNRQKAKLVMSGVGVDNPITVEEAMELFPEFNKRQLRNLRKKPYKSAGRYAEFIANLHRQLPEGSLSEDDPFWEELKQRQHFTNIPTIQVMRLITVLRTDYQLDSIAGKHILRRITN